MQAGIISLFHVPLKRRDDEEGDHHFSIPVPNDELRREETFRSVGLR
jgi:hypothetical protein